MKNIGQILSAEICDYANIKNASIKKEPSRLIVRGENFCKTFYKIKGINYQICENEKKINVTFDINDINGSKIKKHIDIMNLLFDYNDEKHNLLFWEKITNSDNKIDMLSELFKCEKYLSHYTHYVYNSDKMQLNDKFYKRSSSQIEFISDQKNYQFRKTIGGILWDYNFSFLEDMINLNYKGANGTRKKNILIADTVSNCNHPTFEFIKNDSVNNLTNFSNKRLFIYYPAESLITKIISCIKTGHINPKCIWIVFPRNIPHIDFKKIITLLCWSNEELTSPKNIKLVTIKYTNNKNISHEKKKISVERIIYKYNKIEKHLLSSSDDEKILDKFYFSNIHNTMPDIIFDSQNCPICAKKFTASYNMSKSYFNCGHVFCSKCVFDSYKLKDVCPICRKQTHKNLPIIPQLVLSKIEYLKKLLLNLTRNLDSNILIYVDNPVISKGLHVWLKQNFNNIHSEITNKKKLNFKHSIIICTKDSYYLSKNIKHITEVISISTSNDFLINTESLGYDYFYAGSEIRIWLFDSGDNC